MGEPDGFNRSRASNRSRGLLLEEIRYLSDRYRHQTRLIHHDYRSVDTGYIRHYELRKYIYRETAISVFTTNSLRHDISNNPVQ